MKIRWRPLLGLVAMSCAVSAVSVAITYKHHGLIDPIFFARIVGGAIGYFVFAALIPLVVFAIAKLRKRPDGYSYNGHFVCLLIIGALTLLGTLSN